MIIYSILILALLNVLAFYERHIVLYALVGMGNVIFGLHYAIIDFEMWSDNFTVGLVVIVLGIFMVIRAGLKGWNQYVKGDNRE